MKKISFIALIGVALVLTSCQSKSDYPGYTKTEDGLHYQFYEINESAKLPVEGDVMTLLMDYYLNDSLFFTYTQIPEYPYVQMAPSGFKGDLYEGLSMMHIGDSASFIVNADSTFIVTFGARTLPPFVKEGDYVRFEIKMLNQQTQAEFQQSLEEQHNAKVAQSNETLAKYLADNNITETPSASGLVYKITKKGKGGHPKTNDLVKVHYTGKLLDGTVFDSSIERGEPIEFPIGAHRVIPGWDEGIAMMSKGEKGILYIPCMLAYGPDQAGPTIKPYSPLMFEVELVDFSTPETKK